MEIVDAGVLPGSFMDFTTPTSLARNALFYMPQFGHFICDHSYHISRQTLEWFLILYMNAGELEITLEDRTSLAAAGQLVFLDCRKPHRYACTKNADFYWFHFNGSCSSVYADLFCDTGSFIFQESSSEKQMIERIFLYAQEIPVDEHRISLNIQRLLVHMLNPRNANRDHRILNPALDYIRKHYDQSIPLSLLAEKCSMSTSHFIRTFEKHLGASPHEYVLSYRLRQAKQLLVSTNQTIEIIAEQCGFNSASHFARAFRSSNQLSPTEFRKMLF